MNRVDPLLPEDDGKEAFPGANKYLAEMRSIANDITDVIGAEVGERTASVLASEMACHFHSLALVAAEDFLRAAEECQSEIEKTMLAGLLFLETGYAERQAFPASIRTTNHEIVILPQHVIGKYRVDFGVHVRPVAQGPLIRLAVECDGHEFHDKTKEQASRDKKRDRVIAAHGYQVLRFTGSEIYKDVRACVAQIEHVIDQRNGELIKMVCQDVPA